MISESFDIIFSWIGKVENLDDLITVNDFLLIFHCGFLGGTKVGRPCPPIHNENRALFHIETVLSLLTHTQRESVDIVDVDKKRKKRERVGF
jgi:hypothetical protein